MPFIVVPIKAASIVYRSRQNIENSNYCKFEDLSYPPSHLVTKYSRANKPYQQVFYASDNFVTNLAELLPCWLKDYKVGDVFAVTTGQWELTSKLWIALLPDSTNKKMIDNLKSADTLNLSPSDWAYWDYVASFFKELGFSNNDIYKLSSAYCNALIHNAKIDNKNINGILYTSVIDDAGWNLALAPEVADKYFVLKNVVKHYIRKRPPEDEKASYDNYKTPAKPSSIDYKTRMIKWE